MGAPYSLDRRERVVAAVAGGMSRAEAARRFKVSRCSAIRRANVAWTATVSVRTSQRQAAPSASTAHRSDARNRRPGGAVRGRRAAGHPQPDQAHANHPGRRGDVGARDYAGAAARGHHQGEAAGKYKGRPVSIDAAQIRQLRVELGPAAIAKKLGIARSSVYRALGAA